MGANEPLGGEVRKKLKGRSASRPGELGELESRHKAGNCREKTLVPAGYMTGDGVSSTEAGDNRGGTVNEARRFRGQANHASSRENANMGFANALRKTGRTGGGKCSFSSNRGAEFKGFKMPGVASVRVGRRSKKHVVGVKGGKQGKTTHQDVS